MLENIHSVFEIGGLIIGVLLAYIGLLIKDSINEVKLVAAASKLEIVTGQFRIEEAVRTHVATDEIKHDEFDRRLDKLENR